MADGDRAAVRIDARVLEVDAHQLEAAEHLAGEGLVSRRGCSSRLIFSPAASFFLAGRVMAWISPWKKPSFSAVAYFCWEASANSSACSRVMPKSFATLSPVCGIEWSPNCLMNRGFGKRVPMVLSYSLTSLL